MPALVEATGSPKQKEIDEEEQARIDLDAFLTLARKRFSIAEEAEAENRKASLEDLEFFTGEQWPNDVKAARSADGRPCLTINRLKGIKNQVTNEQRQQRPAIQVNPRGDGASTETAEVYQGIIRDIEVNSDAEIAYDSSFEGMVIGGFSYFRVLTDYLPGLSFEQELKIKRIKNPFTVYFDPTCIEPDYSDANWAFIIEDLSKQEYKAQFPKSEAASMVDFSSIGDQSPGWAAKETIRIAEYFHVEHDTQPIVLLDDNRVMLKEHAPKDAVIVKSRDMIVRRVVWTKINAIEKLKETSWLGQWIPIIPVLGDDLDVNGKRYLAGLIRNAKDAQKQYNYMNSAATEQIALATKAPYLAVEGQMEGFEKMWEQANVRNFSFLYYKAVDVQGKPAPPPTRNAVEPPIQAMAVMIRQADNDLKSTTGIYDASLGERGPDQSGKAILARQKQGDVATLNFSDNLARSIRFLGKQLVDLIPRVYTAARIQRIIKPDQTVDHVGIWNSSMHDAGTDPRTLPGMTDPSIKRIFDIGTGRYDVTVSVGPSYQSKRQEAVSSQLALIQADPDILKVAGDLLIRNMDWPGSKEIADRVKKMLPPQLQDDNGDPAAQLQKAQSQLQQLNQQHELLTQHLTAANETIKSKQQEQEAKMSIAKAQIDADLIKTKLELENKLAIAEITTKAQDRQQRAQLEQDMWMALHNSAHDAATQATDQTHEAGMQTADQQHEAQLQQAQQQHEGEQATQSQGAEADQATQAQAAAQQQQESAQAAEPQTPGE